MNTIGRLDREDLLKRGGLASLALVSLPALAHALETRRWQPARRTFTSSLSAPWVAAWHREQMRSF
jgi:hypothetical protein